MRLNVLFLLTSAIVISPIPAAAVNFGGDLFGGSHDVRVDSVRFASGAETIPWVTTGWSVHAGQTDTFAFRSVPWVPAGAILFGAVDLGRMIWPVDSIVSDTWYQYETDSVLPEVRFRLPGSGVDERPGRAMPRLTVTPRVFKQGITMQVSGGATFEVYDAAGNLVRTFADVAGGASWNGDNARGKAMPDGVYYVRAATPGGTATAKVVLVR